MLRLKLWSGFGLMAGAVAASAGAAEPSAHAVLASIDLTHTFGTRSAWFFTASQAAPGQDPLGMSDEVAGVVTICLRNGASGACDPQLRGALHAPSDDPFNLPHYLIQARIVYPDRNSRRPLLLVKTASLHSGDGDQLELTQVLAYESGADQFVRIFELSTGHNNNQEVRYMDAGPLQGDIISVEPTENAPFGFWVSVNALTPSYTYQQSVRYRSATRYGDGNPLSVIDSEMPNIQQNLGLWRPGSPLPLTASPCPRPHLVRAELWCK